MRWAGHIARIGARSGVYRVLVGKLEGRIPLGGPRHTRDGNIKIDVRELGWVMGWIDLAQDRGR